MDFYKLFYFLTVGDKLTTLFAWIAVLATIFLIISTLILLFGLDSDATEEDLLKSRAYKNLKRLQIYTMILSPLFLFLWIGTPNKKEAVLIIGGGYVGNFISTDTSAKKIPADITNFLRTNLQLAAKEAQVEIGNLTQSDTLKNKTKEELLEIIKSQNK